MATATNTVSIKINDGIVIYIPDLTGALPILNGQICVYDGTLNSGGGGVRPATAQADLAAAATTGFAGIAEENSILNSLVEQLPTVKISFKNVYMLHTTAAETYKMGTKVYFNEAVAGSQTITTSTNTGARTVAVGYVILPNQTMLAGATSVTGAAGLDIPVAIVANFPIVSLA